MKKSVVLFEFLAYCLDIQKPVPNDIKKIDWDVLYDFCKKQSITGIGFEGVQRLAKEDIKIPKQILIKWYYQSEKIKKHNKLMNCRAVEVCRQLEKSGFYCVVLKGQGNTLYYPEHYSRISGDIDIWMKPQEIEANVRESIINYVRKEHPNTDIRYVHIEYAERGVPIEAHFIPGYMNNPFYNRRLQKYYNSQMDIQCQHYVELPDNVGGIPIPTVEFNIVFQLAHMMHHFFDEGIGLRQMIDYYYLLRFVSNDSVKIVEQLKYLNLYHFAGAVMYIMKKVLGLDDKYLIVPVDERRGNTLLKEIIKGGNFGKYSQLAKQSIGKKHFMKIWRAMHFVREYPAEALSEPIFRTWHFFWRWRHR